MTATQSFRIYEILQRHFKNSDDAKIVVQEIEQIIEAKVDGKVNVLATKEDLLKLKEELKEDLLRFQIDVEKRFNNNVLWIVGTGIGIVGLIFSIIKLFIVK
jgi:demethoxyubiquinone hydroxylase (CLK1/Coq7/Cat5 family)